jgi:hypothetical protein
MKRPKDKGTRAETVVCDYLHDELGVEAMRRVMQGGGNDRGDVVIPDVPVMFEVKDCRTLSLTSWAREVDRQVVNASARYGVLIWSPPGLGPRSVDRWITLEWPDTALTPFPEGGTLFTGPLSKLPAAMAEYGDRWPLYFQARGVLEVRCRLFGNWICDLREYLAKQSLAR